MEEELKENNPWEIQGVKTPCKENAMERCILGNVTNTPIHPPPRPDSLSPTANLRLLTKVATHVDREPRGSHSFVPQDMKREMVLRLDLPPDGFDIPESSNGRSRKEKSLGLLCDRFLSMFPLNLPPCGVVEVSLDHAAGLLGTERRRIYDIVNVLESLQMVSKIGKNRYAWHGNQHLQHTLARLKALAEKAGLCNQASSSPSSPELRVLQPHELNLLTRPLLVPEPTDHSGFHGSRGHDCDEAKRERSLGIMCQKFLMLLLMGIKPRIVPLDLAARVLLGESAASEPSRLKTKVRRLYDIANVLTSLGLVEKLQVSAGRGKKPAFRYTGPPIEADLCCSQDPCAPPPTRHSLLCNTPVIDYSQNNTGPSDAKRRRMMFSRTRSDSSLNQILHVAELELQRLTSQPNSESPIGLPQHEEFWATDGLFNTSTEAVPKSVIVKRVSVPPMCKRTSTLKRIHSDSCLTPLETSILANSGAELNNMVIFRDENDQHVLQGCTSEGSRHNLPPRTVLQFSVPVCKNINVLPPGSVFMASKGSDEIEEDKLPLHKQQNTTPKFQICGGVIQAAPSSKPVSPPSTTGSSVFRVVPSSSSPIESLPTETEVQMISIAGPHNVNRKSVLTTATTLLLHQTSQGKERFRKVCIVPSTSASSAFTRSVIASTTSRDEEGNVKMGTVPQPPGVIFFPDKGENTCVTPLDQNARMSTPDRDSSLDFIVPTIHSPETDNYEETN